MSVEQEAKPKRRLLFPEKKYQIFLESHSGKRPVGEILRREGIYATDLVRIREKVKGGALERLADRRGAKREMVSSIDYLILKSICLSVTRSPFLRPDYR